MSFFFIIWFYVPMSLHQSQAHPCKESSSVDPSGTRVDCHNLHLHHIPPDLPQDTVWLDFSNNKLDNLTDYMFQDLPLLVHLDLTTCSISKLESNAFAGLKHLDELNLAHNKLHLDDETYPQDVFIPLTNLTYLNIGGNDKNTEGTTPDHVFINLPNLKTLYIDTFQDEIFGPGFSVMTELKSLVLSDAEWHDGTYCSILRLYNNTFLAFENSSIELLNLEYCELIQIEVAVYMPLPHISEIVLTKVQNTLIESAIKSLFGVNGKNISRLEFNQMNTKNIELEKQVIKKNTLKYLTNICVEYLDLSENCILFVPLEFITTFSKCIKHLDLSRNSLYGNGIMLFMLNKFERLEFFDLSHQQRWRLGRGQSLLLQSGHVQINLPPTLRVFNISSDFGKFAHLDQDQIVVNGSGLRTLNISFNGIKHMVHQCKGVETVENLDISGNHGNGISGQFIQSFPYVKQLTMNGIEPNQLALVKGTSFYNGIKSLIHVESVRIESNNIQYLGSDIFNDMMNLTSISLADNNFVDMPLHISKISNLGLLDLSLNSITYLPFTLTEYLDILEENQGFTLKLKQNPISCSCQTLDFIHWLFTTRVVLDEDGNYNCVTEDGQLTTTLKVYKHFNYHWTHCQGRFWLPFTISLMCLIAMVLFASVLINRNWTRVQHRIMVILGKGVQRVTRQDFQKDAYITHSEEDGRLVLHNLMKGLEKLKLRLILPDRDFLPGRYVADNVVESVNNSWKTVLIITDSFLEDPWSYFIMRTVSYSVSYPNSNRVILLMIGDVNQARLPESLLNVTEEEDILQTDDIPGPGSEMWTQLRDRIVFGGIE